MTGFPQDRGYAGVTNLTWIRAVPPTYLVRAEMGEGVSGPIWFEGCKPRDPSFTVILAGPVGFTALYAGGTIEVLYEGRTIGTIEPGDGAINPRWVPQR